MISRFRKGTGCFTCTLCGKRTRDTGDNGSVEMCPLCDAKSGCENTLSDTTNIPNPWGRFDSCKTVDEVNALCDKLINEYEQGSAEADFYSIQREQSTNR